MKTIKKTKETIVKNPYVIGDPVEGGLFLGREYIMRELRQLWMNSQAQSVLLYGEARMGKTSILKNIAKSSGVNSQVIYVNVQSLQSISLGMGEVFLAISDEIADKINLAPPNTLDLLKLPQRTFKLYLKLAIRKLENKRLIIALDEFEGIENLINTQQLPPNFMAVLESFVQMSPQIAFIFTGLHTLEEITQDYFQTFSSSIIPISVSFLNKDTTHKILANPDPNFLLKYEPETIDHIYNITSGQPYLVQLLGFLLVKRYNKQVFEEEKPKKGIFTVDDVNSIIEENDLFEIGHYYFTGVWGKAGRNAPEQQSILKALANNSGSCNRAMIEKLTGLDETIINNALKRLFSHSIIIERDDNLTFAVKLFHRWVIKYQNNVRNKK